MKEKESGELLLGKATPIVEEYSPQLLFPIPRQQGRSGLGLSGELPFGGVDLWHAYEMSWLDQSGKPLSYVGRFSIPAESPNMVESKSFKLYLNSLNNTKFSDKSEAENVMAQDLSEVLGVPLKIELISVDDPSLSGVPLRGVHLDKLKPILIAAQPSSDLLKLDGNEVVEEAVFTHLLRSLCPVTGQPDWASVWLKYRGKPITHSSLLTYFIAYRNHQEYHEQCVERMFCDIAEVASPDELQIQACYTRRGGLDINPFRSNDPDAAPLPRLNRQ